MEVVKNDASTYDIIVIGAPIWASTLSTLVRTYISQYKGSSKVAFFCTSGGTRGEPFDEMESLCGKEPAAILRRSKKK